MKPLRKRNAVVIAAAVAALLWAYTLSMLANHFTSAREQEAANLEVWQARHDAGRAALERQDYGTAESFLEENLRFAEDLDWPGDSYVDGSAFALGRCLRDGKTQPRKARMLFERCLAIREANDGTDSITLMPSLRHLSELCLELGDIDASLAYAQRDLAIREHAFGIGDRQLFGSLTNVAAALERQGKYAAALPFRERIVVLERELYRDKTFEFSRALYEQAEILRIQGEYATAEPVYRQSVSLLEAQGTLWAISLKGKAAHGWTEVLRGLGRTEEADTLEAKTMRMQSEELPGE